CRLSGPSRERIRGCAVCDRRVPGALHDWEVARGSTGGRQRLSDGTNPSAHASRASTRVAAIRGRSNCVLRCALRIAAGYLESGQGLAFFLLELRVVVLDEAPDLVGHPQKFFPLLAIQSHRKASQAVYRKGALFTHAQRHLPPRRLLQGFVLGS